MVRDRVTRGQLVLPQPARFEHRPHDRLKLMRHLGTEWQAVQNLESQFVLKCDPQRPFDRVRSAHAATVRLGQTEDDEAFRHVGVQPMGEFRGVVAVAVGQPVELTFGSLQGRCVPDAAQLTFDALANGSIRGVMNGVLGEVELAALPERPREDRLASGAQPGMVVATMNWVPGRPRATRSSRKVRQWISASDRAVETAMSGSVAEALPPSALNHSEDTGSLSSLARTEAADAFQTNGFGSGLCSAR